MQLRAVVAAALVLAGLVMPAESTGAASDSPLSAWGVLTLRLPNSEVAYRAGYDALLVAVDGGVPGLGNDLVEVDPQTGALGRQVPIGASLIDLVVSPDGTRAYGATRSLVIEIDLVEFEIVRRFSPLPPTSTGTPLRRLAVHPDRPEVVAIADGDELAVYESGVLSDRSSGHGRTVDLAFDERDPDILYRLGGRGITIHRVADASLGTIDEVPGVEGESFTVAAGMLTTDEGHVVDLDARRTRPHYECLDVHFGCDAVVVDHDSGRAYLFGTGDMVSVVEVGSHVQLDERRRWFDVGNGAVAIDAGDRLVVSTPGGISVLGPGLSGSPLVLPAPPASVLDGEWRTVPVEATDLVAAPGASTVYAATRPGDSDPDAVVEIDVATGSRLRSVRLGSELAAITVSDDGHTLFVVDSDGRTLTEIDVLSFRVRRQTSLASTDRSAVDVDAVPTMPHAVVVNGHQLVRDGVVTDHPRGGGTVFGAGPARMYTPEGGSRSALHPVDVTALGPGRRSQPLEYLGAGEDHRWVGGRLVSTDGAVDPEQGIHLGGWARNPDWATATHRHLVALDGLDRMLLIGDGNPGFVVVDEYEFENSAPVERHVIASGSVREADVAGRSLVLLGDGTMHLRDLRGPTAPVDVDVVGEPGGALVSWAPPVGDGSGQVTGYRLERDGRPIGDVGPEDRSFSDTGLTAAARHQYVVTAMTAEGRGDRSAAVVGTVAGIDEEPPTILVERPTIGQRLPFFTDHSAEFSCADSGGSGLRSCAGSTADGLLLPSDTIGTERLWVTATDHAGNETTTSVVYRVFDDRPPEIVINTPGEGISYEPWRGDRVDFACIDQAIGPFPVGSGVASCRANRSNGARLADAGPGWHRFTVEAVDRAGNRAARTVRYRVQPLCFGRRVTVDLSEGALPNDRHNVILGTPADDVIRAGDGNDWICGGGGRDTIVGGAGLDHGDGGPGDDVLHGSADQDWLFGRAGADQLIGNDGNDRLDGGAGRDRCAGLAGVDRAKACEEVRTVP